MFMLLAGLVLILVMLGVLKNLPAPRRSARGFPTVAASPRP